ncbi:hypothetical protein ABIF97_008242 [Bradyrhizobium japonicum]
MKRFLAIAAVLAAADARAAPLDDAINCANYAMAAVPGSRFMCHLISAK